MFSVFADTRMCMVHLEGDHNVLMRIFVLVGNIITFACRRLGRIYRFSFSCLMESTKID